MRLTKRNLIIAEFIPVIIAISYYLFQYQFLYFTHTVLGKMVLITIIMFYSIAVDKLLGAVLALLFIFYYQTDFVEGFYSLQMDGGGDSDKIEEGFQDINSDSGGVDIAKITIDKINLESDVIMPKSSNNVQVNKKWGEDDQILMGTTGVISEAFTQFY